MRAAAWASAGPISPARDRVNPRHAYAAGSAARGSRSSQVGVAARASSRTGAGTPGPPARVPVAQIAKPAWVSSALARAAASRRSDRWAVAAARDQAAVGTTVGGAARTAAATTACRAASSESDGPAGADRIGGQPPRQAGQRYAGLDGHRPDHLAHQPGHPLRDPGPVHRPPHPQRPGPQRRRQPRVVQHGQHRDREVVGGGRHDEPGRAGPAQQLHHVGVFPGHDRAARRHGPRSASPTRSARPARRAAGRHRSGRAGPRPRRRTAGCPRPAPPRTARAGRSARAARRRTRRPGRR